MLKNIESRCFHEGWVVYPDFDDLVYVRSMFSHIKFECFLDINEQIVPRFILELYSQYRANFTLEGQMLIEFFIQNQFFSYTLEKFGQILGVPSNGTCSFTDKWSLDDLQYTVPTSGPYQTDPPCPDEIKNYIQEEWEGSVTRICHKTILLDEENEILTREIVTIMKTWVEIIRENVFCLGDDYYDLHDRVMYPLTVQQERKTRKDYGTKRGRHSTSSSPTFAQPSSSHLNDDDNDGNDEGTSRASTPSPTLSLVNQDLLYLKKGNSGPKKFVLSLHKFPIVIFPDVNIEERTFRWVDKCVKNFNAYTRYSVEHWKNPHAKIFYIKRQKEPGMPKEEVYSNSKIVQVIKTYVFIRSTVIWERVHDFQLGVESYQQKVNLIAPTITFPGIEKYKMFSIVSELVYDIIYKNNKKEKRVMRHQEVHKFCDATLKRVLEGLKSYNKDVKHGYVTPSLSKEDVEYLQLFKEEIEERLKHHDQMRLDHALWEVIVNGDSVSPVASASAGAEGPIPPKTAEQKLARKNELKAKSTLMLAIPDEHLLKFHACKDEKSLWEAIKNRFGGNKESKKMQKSILKQNYENFAASSQEGLEDANLKLLRSLPSTWNNIALIMRNKSNLDILSIDDLYNNLKVTNETVNTAHNVSAASSKDQASTASYADDVMFSFFSNQSNAQQLDNEDLEQIDSDDLEEMDLKWQVAMLTMRVKRFIKKTGRKLDLNDKETVGFDRIKGNRNRDDPRRNAPVDTSTTNALVVQDRIGGYDWSFQAEDGLTNFALMAYTSQGSSNLSSSDSEVHTCSKDCLKSYEALQKHYDQQREALNKSNLEIRGYQMGLESLEARIVVNEKNEAVYEEGIAFLKYDVQVKDISIKGLKNQLENALKERDDLKLKLEKFETSSKNLTNLINSQISVKDKTGLGYDGQMNESDLNDIHVNESEVLDNVFDSVFDSRESNGDNNQVNDMFKKGEGYHAVPPPYTGNYMPPRPDLSFARLDDSVFKSTVSETITSVSKIDTIASKTSKDSLEKPKTVRSSAPLIEEWESDSEDENVFKPKEVKITVKPSFEKIEFVYAMNATVEKPRKFSQSPRDNKRNWNGLMT
ncbi:hypothetical protein Tco_0890482 [Tanacetum coccineum]|uniref:Uncharacterized protein n=1 Tax=Tanacetum coccineum TaxID=301880 RepID=A0ABQ5C065_9ASTR